MRSGDIDQAPIWDDVTTLREELLPRIDIISGGFPCQDLSVAGRGKGLDGERSGLFFEIARLVRECQPGFVFLENVPAIRTRGGERVVKELASLGYDCRWTTLSAASVGAPHKRERWFLLANATNHRRNGGSNEQGKSVANRPGKDSVEGDGKAQLMAHSNSLRKLSEQREHDRASNGNQDVAHAPSERIQGLRSSGEQEPGSHGETGLFMCEGKRPIQSDWSVEPDVGRVAYGVSNRVDRIKCLGNSVVPAQVREAFKKLAGLNIYEKEETR